MTKPISRFLLPALLIYTAATTTHFIHNTVYLANYPNMPDWISRITVVGSLSVLIALGATGYLMLAKGYRVVGLLILGVYAVFGFDGLAHYSLAPLAEHTAVMNLTIWTEVTTAAVLLLTVVFEFTRGSQVHLAQ